MAGKVLETTIRISGDLDTSVQKALDGVLSNMDEIEAASRKATGAIGAVAGKIADQSKVLEVAKRKYASYVLEGKESTEQAQKLADEIRELSADMKKNEAALKAAEDAADRLTGDLDDLEEAAKDTKDGFTIMKGAAAELVAEGIMAIASSCIEAVKSIYGLSESTREYREDMGKLETAWESAGKSTELASDIYREFYSVLGEEDRSVEAVNHLAKFVDTEKDMMKWTNIAAGVWGTFGDSLPIEGLTEAANETAKVGKVTGVLADALNWAGINEDTFNASLEQMNSEQERAAYITDTLNGLYSDAADNYRDNNSSIMDARKATADYNDSLADIGEAIEPITTAVQSGLGGLLQVAADLIQKVDLASFAGKITEAFEKMSPVIEQLITDAMPFLTNFLEGILNVLPVLLPLFMELINTILPPLLSIIELILPPLFQIIEAVMPVLQDILSALMPVFVQIVSAIMPVLVRLIDTLLPLVYPLLDVLMLVLNDAIMPLLEPLLMIVEALLPILAPLLTIVLASLQPVFDLLQLFTPILAEIIGWIAKVVGWVADGLNWVVNLIFGDTSGEIAEAAEVEGYATGGITNGLSIAGEDPNYPNEYIISLNPAYRSANLSYWAEAGRMLGADASDFYLGGGDSEIVYDMGGVTFAPNIVVHGNADKESIMEAIEEEYPEFLDMLEKWLSERGKPVYA